MSHPKVLFLTPYPKGTAASQRFRFEQYYEYLEEAGFKIQSSSFLDRDTWDILYKERFGWKKFWGLVKGFAKRKWVILNSWRFDYVFVHRELAPLGPPVFEWWISKVLRKKLIYDFDDSIWMENTTSANSLAARMKWHSKVSSICRWSYKVSCGNQFLMDYASQYNNKVILNPTTIDADDLHVPKNIGNQVPVIGWTGTHSTLKYLKLILEPLTQLAAKHEFVFQVIADQAPDFEITNLLFMPWSKETEIHDLNQIDIGVMPLEDNEWSKGKCGFKALQFMALEKPVLVSPVGINDLIAEEGVSGFHCSDNQQWFDCMEKLLLDVELRTKFGKAGRQKVINEFSVKSNQENFLSLFS